MNKKPCTPYIAVPSMEMVHAEFMNSMVEMLIYFTNVPLPEPWRFDGFKYMNRRSSLLSQLREDLAQLAIDAEATHILFIDSDMTFPKDTLHRLLGRNKPVVAANCVIKNIPSAFTARNLAPGNVREEVPTKPPEEKQLPLERVWRVGTGVMLVEVAAVKKIKKPRFPITWNPELDTYTGEDWNFVKKLHEEAGVSTYVDHQLSWEIGHIGAYKYTAELAWQRIMWDQMQKERKVAEGGKS